MPLADANDPEIITKSAAIIDVLTPEKYAYLLSLLPTIEGYSALHNRFEASYAGSLKGGTEQLKACEADRMAIKQEFNMLLGLIKIVTPKDPTLPEALKLSQIVTKKSTAPGTLTAPKGFHIFFDATGVIFASVTRLPSAKGYQIWCCDSDPAVEANWHLLTSSTNCQKISISGLNRTKTNWLRIRGIRGKNTGPWSNYISLPPA